MTGLLSLLLADSVILLHEGAIYFSDTPGLFAVILASPQLFTCKTLCSQMFQRVIAPELLC